MANIVLLCGHSYAARGSGYEVGQDYFCGKCRYAMPIRAIGSGWVVRCTDCRYSRTYGGARTAALCHASKHMVYQSHTVHCYNADDRDGTLSVHSPVVSQLVMELDENGAPF